MVPVYIYMYNVKSGLINTPLLINLLLPTKMQLKHRWSPQINKHFGISPINKPPVLKSHVSNNFSFQFYLSHHSQNSSLLYLRFKLIIENFKNNYSPNDRFLIKLFIKIISLDSSQRVPPMSPCPPLIITRVCPLLINPLSDPWDFNNQILSNPMEFYEDLIDVSHIQSFMVQKMLIIKGGSTRSTLTFWGGVLIRCSHCMLTFGVYWWDPCYHI